MGSPDEVLKSWGVYRVLAQGESWKLKVLTLNPSSSTSKQSHNSRAEHWYFPKTGEYRFVDKGEIHQLCNETTEPLTVIELQVGYCDEGDIVRY